MSGAHLAAIAPPKTPRCTGESVAWAGEAFEPMPLLLMGSLPPRFAGARARGTLAIDVPRNLAATPSGPLFATAVVERGAGFGIPLRPAPTGKGMR